MHAQHNAGMNGPHTVTCRPDVVLSHAADLCGASGQLSHSHRRGHWANSGAPLNMLPDSLCPQTAFLGIFTGNLICQFKPPLDVISLQ